MISRFIDVVYEPMLKEVRINFQSKRIDDLAKRKNFGNLYLTSFNGELDRYRAVEQKKVESADYSRLNSIWNLDKQTEEPVSYTHLTLPTILLV